VEFVVEDSGIGIARDRRGRLFKSFSQVDSSITRQYGGTGLGLAICGRLCAAMGGEIHLESEPGAGTSCRVVLPLPVASEPVVDTAEPTTAPSAASCSRVLVVEDNSVNRVVACRLLEACGVRPDLATNGREAVAMVREKEFDLILMDMQMPEMDGLEATRVIRQMALPRRPQIIALTANAFESDRRLCLEADMDGFLAKPLRLIELRALLERMRGEPSLSAVAEHSSRAGGAGR
jgi:CheY-like chemotaxis protein